MLNEKGVIVKILHGISLFVTMGLTTSSVYSQGVGINSTGVDPDNSAILDVESTVKGILFPRMTTAERNSISNPANSLLIFNTTTECYEGYHSSSSTWVAFGCIGCSMPTGVSASASPNPICESSTLTLSGVGTNVTSWNWTGPNGYTSTDQNPTILNVTSANAGVYTLSAGNTCGWSTSNTASVVVNAAPTIANAGADISPSCGETTATLSGNTPTVGSGTWSVISGTATITTPSSPTSGVTGLTVSGSATLRWTISNAPCAASFDDVVITTTSCGYVCAGDGTFVDARDGKTYGYIDIGAQRWMCQNLAYLPSVVPPGTGSTGAPRYYVPGYSGTDVAAAKATSNYDAYGTLYNWPAAMNGASSSSSTPSGVQGICPAGWHLPSDDEWCIVENTVEPGTDPGCSISNSYRGVSTGDKMKEAGPTHWGGSNTGTNTSGFTGRPAGYRHTNGTFFNIGSDVAWWTSEEESSASVLIHELFHSQSGIQRAGSGTKAFGLSVRCIKD